MRGSLLSHFCLGPCPSSLLDAEVRSRLGRAILENDPPAFRAELDRSCSDIASEHRLYGVLSMTDRGMTPIMVDETGNRLGPGSTISKEIPIHLLNVEFTLTGIRVTAGDEVWVLPQSNCE